MYEKSNERIPKWAQELITIVKSIDQRLNNVEHDLSEVKSRTARLEVEVGSISKRLEKVEQSVATIQSLDSIKREIEEQKQRDDKSKNNSA